MTDRDLTKRSWVCFAFQYSIKDDEILSQGPLNEALGEEWLYIYQAGLEPQEQSRRSDLRRYLCSWFDLGGLWPEAAQRSHMKALKTSSPKHGSSSPTYVQDAFSTIWS